MYAEQNAFLEMFRQHLTYDDKSHYTNEND